MIRTENEDKVFLLIKLSKIRLYSHKNESFLSGAAVSKSVNILSSLIRRKPQFACDAVRYKKFDKNVKSLSLSGECNPSMSISSALVRRLKRAPDRGRGAEGQRGAERIVLSSISSIYPQKAKSPTTCVAGL